jgi:GDP-mannose 6-dehydrogenase
LLGRGMDVAVYDEEVRIAKLFGRNREYIERTIPHLAELLKETAEEVVGHGEVIVICRPMRNLETFLQHRRPGQIVVDLARTPAAATTPKAELLRIV